MIAADPDNLTAHDIASEAAWADRYRDSDRNGSRQHYEQTWRWNFVNAELDDLTLVELASDIPLCQPARSRRMA
jgi:hypothetical protein